MKKQKQSENQPASYALLALKNQANFKPGFFALLNETKRTLPPAISSRIVFTSIQTAIFQRPSLSAVLVLLFMMNAACPATSYAKPVDKQSQNIMQTEAKEISGEVSMVTFDRIAVLQSKPVKGSLDDEIVFHIDEETLISNIEKISDIQIGDRVHVGYEELKWSENGEERIQRTTNSVRFLGKAGGSRVLAN